MKAKSTVMVKPIGIFQDKKIFVLIGILILIVFVIVYQWNDGPVLSSGVGKDSTTRSKTSGGSGGFRGKVKEDPLRSTDAVVIFSELQEKPAEFPGEKRNIFSFYVPPPPPQPVVMVKAPPPPPPPVCGDQSCQPGESYESCPSDCPPPPPPPIDLKYIGYLKEREGTVAFLTDGKEVFMGRVNDIIANKYRVIRIADDSVELGYVNLTTNQSKTIPFEGNVKS